MKTRLDWVTTEVRNRVTPNSLGPGPVFHYSIPAFDSTGDGALEDPADIGSAKTLLSGGEVLISKLNPRKARILVAEARDSPTVCSGEFVVLRPERIEAKYLGYLLSSELTRQSLDARVQSVTRSQQRVRPEDVTKMWIDLPPRGEQAAIVSFLDAETARIDALIAKKRRMIDLLAERRRVQVSSMVFGRDGNHRMVHQKALGPMPASWEAARLRYCVQITVGVVVNPSSYFADDGVPFIHGSDIRDGWIDVSNLKYLSAESNDLLPKSQLRAGDVVVVRAGYPGRAAVVPTTLDRANCASILILRRGSVLEPEFLCHFLNCREARIQVSLAQYGAAQEQINVSDIVDFVAPVPPASVQRDLVDRIDQAQRRSDRQTDILQRQIRLLTERRAALITAAVTGQFEVPGVAA